MVYMPDIPVSRTPRTGLPFYRQVSGWCVQVSKHRPLALAGAGFEWPCRSYRRKPSTAGHIRLRLKIQPEVDVLQQALSGRPLVFDSRTSASTLDASFVGLLW